MGDILLRIENLSLKRNGRYILKQVNLTVRRGEIHGILGLNGVGKSSLAYTIMGCTDYIPDEGRILFEERDITHLPITERWV
jgi:Fe-S cluster assembly ATP-binding protein